MTQRGYSHILLHTVQFWLQCTVRCVSSITLSSAQGTHNTAHVIQDTWHFTLPTTIWTMFIKHRNKNYNQYTEHRTLHTSQFKLYYAYCTVYTEHCTLHNSHRTVQMVFALCWELVSNGLDTIHTRLQLQSRPAV